MSMRDKTRTTPTPTFFPTGPFFSPAFSPRPGFTSTYVRINGKHSSKSTGKVGKPMVAPFPGMATGRNVVFSITGKGIDVESHLPGIYDVYDQFAAKGVKNIFVVQVASQATLDATINNCSLKGKVTACADPNGAWAKANGVVAQDGDNAISKRTAWIVDDGVVKSFEEESSLSSIGSTSAHAILEALNIAYKLV